MGNNHEITVNATSFNGLIMVHLFAVLNLALEPDDEGDRALGDRRTGQAGLLEAMRHQSELWIINFKCQDSRHHGI